MRDRHTQRLPEPRDYVTLVEWIDDVAAARRWAGPEIDWPLDGPGLATALYRSASTRRALVDEHDRLAAFGEYYPCATGRLRLARLIVDPARRGQRVVDALVEALICHAHRHLFFETVELGVFTDNRPALRAYRRLGFSAIEDTRHPDIVSMQRELSA